MRDIDERVRAAVLNRSSFAKGNTAVAYDFFKDRTMVIVHETCVLVIDRSKKEISIDLGFNTQLTRTRINAALSALDGTTTTRTILRKGIPLLRQESVKTEAVSEFRIREDRLNTYAY